MLLFPVDNFLADFFLHLLVESLLEGEKLCALARVEHCLQIIIELLVTCDDLLVETFDIIDRFIDVSIVMIALRKLEKLYFLGLLLLDEIHEIFFRRIVLGKKFLRLFVIHQQFAA